MKKYDIPFYVQKRWEDDDGVDWAQATHRDGVAVNEKPFKITWTTLTLPGEGVSDKELVDKINASAEFYDDESS